MAAQDRAPSASGGRTGCPCVGTQAGSRADSGRPSRPAWLHRKPLLAINGGDDMPTCPVVSSMPFRRLGINMKHDHGGTIGGSFVKMLIPRPPPGLGPGNVHLNMARVVARQLLCGLNLGHPAPSLGNALYFPNHICADVLRTVLRTCVLPSI